LFGWRVEGEIPNVKRLLIIAAPHTSNWDFVFAMAAILGLNLRIRWLGKHTVFKPGVKWFMDWLGGIPIDRGNPRQLVEHVVDISNRENGVAIGLAPEGTRAKVSQWKSGFLRIAKLTECSIVMVALDFEAKRFLIGDIFVPTDDNPKDIDAIKAYYSGFKGKIPDNF
jgi:1-acyl-sn-glycerol-3-phosphate acyltransferase